MPRSVIHTENAPRAVGPYSQAIKLTGESLIFVSGQIALDPKTGDKVHGGIAQETRMVLDNLKAILEAAGSSLEKVVKTTVFLQSLDDHDDVHRVWAAVK